MQQYEGYDAELEKICDLAATSAQTGDITKALELINSILEQFPFYPRALHAKGLILQSREQLQEAVDIIQLCLDRNPFYLDALNTLGSIFRQRYQYEDSLGCYERIVAIDPDNVSAHFNLGLTKFRDLNPEGAFSHFQKVIELDSHHVPALMYISSILTSQKKLSEAEVYCRRILAFDAENEDALLQIGSIQSELGWLQQSLEYHTRVKHSKRHGFTAHANIIYHSNMLPQMTQQEIYLLSREFASLHGAASISCQSVHINSPVPERKLRIGFVSADLKLHPVAKLLLSLVKNLDRNHFELYAYNNFNVHDSVTEMFKSLFCYWRNIHEISDEKATEMVRLDTIDILIDLSGYTGHSRLLLFARKPAPIQVTWLGYFNTTGFDAIDYLISDSVTIKKEEEQWFSEKILRMPHSRFCYETLAEIPKVRALPALKAGRITFGSFNKVKKINDEVIKAWAGVLVSVPESRLILKWNSYREQIVVDRILAEFALYGISPDRIIFRDESIYIELLNEYTSEIDISLDTFPHAGGATSFDSLLMGVPVVTLSGNLAISRQTHGILKVMGLEDELVAYSLEEYVTKAATLALNIPRLKQMRKSLRRAFLESPLCDGPAFAHDFERLMRSIWKTWCDGKSINSVLSQKNLSENEVYNEGINLMECHAYAEAVSFFAKVVSLNRRNDRAMNNLGICLSDLGRLEEAEQVLRSARKVNKLNDDVCCNLAGLLLLKKKYATALYYSEAGLEINDTNTELYINKCKALHGLARHSDALQVLNDYILKFPPTSQILSMYGNSYLNIGNIHKAYDYLQQAVELDQDNIEAHSNLLFVMNYNPSYSQKQIFEESLKCGLTYSVDRVKPFTPYEAHTSRKLRVGLVSADFNFHPGGMLLKQFMEHYDRDSLSVCCYYNNTRQDRMTDFIRTHADKWHEVKSLSNQELCDTIKNDKIDILIDMSGHTDGTRLRMFSMKPCRVQASWLGYFNTTGVESIDYFISDYFTTPSSMQEFFSEKIVYLPNSRFCFAQPDNSPLFSLAPAEYNNYVTFGAFNNYAKMTDLTIQLWARVLKAVPNSRLMLKWKSFKDKAVRDDLINRFIREGVSKKCIILNGATDHSQMLADYSDVDIVLDTYPFNGGMTSLEALWMGVPIVTLAGSTPASRQTGSFLRLLGLDDLITYDRDSYVEAAVKLASDRARLYDIRGTLRESMKRSPLMDGKRFAKDMLNLFEKIYRT